MVIRSDKNFQELEEMLDEIVKRRANKDKALKITSKGQLYAGTY
jgi:hypothetical protein